MTRLLTWDNSALHNSELFNDEYYWTCMHLKSPASHTAINSVRTSVIVRKILTWGQLDTTTARTTDMPFARMQDM